MESNTILYKPLGDVIEFLTDYHANGAYEKLKENVTLLDKESHAVMIRTTNFEANDFTNNLIYIDEHAYEYLKKSKVYASDLIMNKIANPGTVYFMPEISKPVSLGMNLFLIRINTKKANPYFIYAYLRKNEHYVKSFASGSTTKTITKDDVRRLKIYTPPLAEQNKIAQILSTWDQAISATEKLLENSQQQKKALMQQLLTGKKRLLDETGVSFSEKWKTYKLKEICHLGAGVSAPQDEKYFLDGQYDFLRVSDLGSSNSRFAPPSRDKLNSTAIAELRMSPVSAGATLFTKSGASLLLNQRAQLQADTYIVSHIGFAKAIENFSSDDYLYYLFCNIDFKNLAAGTSLPALQLSVLSGYQLKIPSVAEQEKISEVLSVADKEIEILQKELDCLKQEKKALMQQLLTGKKRVKVAA